MDNISKVYEKLLSLKSTKLILDDGRGRKLYDVAISPAFRTKYFKYNSPQRVEGLELKTKADITGNVYEKGWVLIDNRQQLKDRQPNPRPRKYASDAERQAAYRNRASMVEFRADEKTAEKLTEIATTLDISRSDLLLSMVKFALTNHQWARFGLTHKTLPRYEENPMTTKKFSPAQIAAQKLFAERARAGTLGKTAKRNPEGKSIFNLGGGYFGSVTMSGYNEYYAQVFYRTTDSSGSTDDQIVPDYKPRYFVSAKSAVSSLMRYKTKNLGRKTNPDKSKPRAYVKRVSQATGAPPSKRLITRRKKALTAPAGYFPNPYTMGKSKKKANFPYCVETKATENWSTQSCFKTLAPAKEYAVALSKKYPKLAIRVMQYAGGAM